MEECIVVMNTDVISRYCQAKRLMSSQNSVMALTIYRGCHGSVAVQYILDHLAFIVECSSPRCEVIKTGTFI